jgi:hypothetical protein
MVEGRASLLELAVVSDFGCSLACIIVLFLRIENISCGGDRNFRISRCQDVLPLRFWSTQILIQFGAGRYFFEVQFYAFYSCRIPDSFFRCRTYRLSGTSVTDISKIDAV